MEARALLNALHVAERLKDETRHCDTSGGRRESVAEHSWRIALMAFWMQDDFPDIDIDKVIRMCLIHDLGECFIGDIPTFAKTAADDATATPLPVRRSSGSRVRRPMRTMWFSMKQPPYSSTATMMERRMPSVILNTRSSSAGISGFASQVM